MSFQKEKVIPIFSPKVALCDLSSRGSRSCFSADLAFITSLFPDAMAVKNAVPSCDVLFIYADINEEGEISQFSSGLREIVRDSGAKVVIFADENRIEDYILAGKQRPYGRANLVMLLNRRGDAFRHFITALFSKMKSGISMPVAWTSLNPQIPQAGKLEAPSAIFACEIGPIVFE